MAPPPMPAQRPRPRGRRRLVNKIVISLAGFFAAFGLSRLVPIEDDAIELVWNVGGSLFVAGIVFISQFLFEVAHRMDDVEQTLDDHATRTGARLDEHARVTERQMFEGLSKIHLAAEVFDLREKSQADPEVMRPLITLVRCSTRIATDAEALVRRFAQTEIARLAEYLKQLGDGSDLAYDGEDRDWLLGLTKAAEHSVQATSLSTVDAGGRSFTDGGLWFSELGLTYLEVQAEAIERGVKIQRIFVVDRQGLPVDDLNKVLASHLRIGVEVRALDAKPAPGVHNRLRDLIIFDNVLCYHSTPDQPVAGLSPIIVATTLVTNPRKVSKRQREFNQLWYHDNVNLVSMGESDELFLTPADSTRAASSKLTPSSQPPAEQPRPA